MAQPLGIKAETPSQAYALAPAERDWLLVQAYLYLEQGKPGEAVTLLRVLFHALPEDAEVHRCLSLAELLAGRPHEAARVAVRALRYGEESFRLPTGLVFARALWEQGTRSAAREYLATLLAVPELAGVTAEPMAAPAAGPSAEPAPAPEPAPER